MEKIVEQLKMAGIHVIKNDFDIILEVFDKELNNISEINFLIHELFIAAKRNEFNRILFVCSETLLHKPELFTTYPSKWQ